MTGLSIQCFDPTLTLKYNTMDTSTCTVAVQVSVDESGECIEVLRKDYK